MKGIWSIHDECFSSFCLASFSKSDVVVHSSLSPITNMQTSEPLVHHPHNHPSEEKKKQNSPSALSSSSSSRPCSSSSAHPSSSFHNGVPQSIAVPQVGERESNPSIHLPPPPPTSSSSVLAGERRDLQREEERYMSQHDLHDDDGSPSSSISWQRRAFSPIERGSIRGSIFTLASSCLGAGNHGSIEKGLIGISGG